MGVQYGEQQELLCESTPCDVTLPYGDYDLRFVGTLDPNRKSTATLHVHEPLVALRHVLGAISPAKRNAGPIMVGLGSVLAISSLLAFATATKVQPNGQPDSGPATAAGVLCLSGIGLMIGGAVVLNTHPLTEQPGATTQWTPPPRPAAGASLSLRF